MTEATHETDETMEGEKGHVEVGMLALIGAAGAIALGIGVAADSDIVAIGGGIATGVGIFVGSLLRHRVIDYDVYRRLENLEK
ncbi:MAG: hypothetical protein WD904_03335 [Dehalococcoidia bacterium]